MLKANVIILIASLLLAKLRWPYAMAALACVTLAEMAYLVMNGERGLLHLAVEFAILTGIGQIAWLVAATLMVL